jgi:RimJ/RimL family protein N-acetyltransferase
VIDLDRHPDGTATLVVQATDRDWRDVAERVGDRLRREFGSSGLAQVTWRAPVGDVPARRVAWASGFTFEGVNRLGWYDASGRRDAWTGTLIADDTTEPKTVWREPVTLAGERVLLRPMRAADEAGYLESINDAVTQEWLGTVPGIPRDPAGFRRRLDNQAAGWSSGASVGWTIADPDDDAYLGTVDLFGFDGLAYRSAESGYRLHADARGRGLLTTALRMVLGHAFTPEAEGGLGLQRVHLGIGDGNHASQAVARRLGFTLTGRDRHNYWRPDGRIVDLFRFDLLATDPAAQDLPRSDALR